MAPPQIMTTNTPQNAELLDALYALADDLLMMGHVSSDWTGLAPILEEDIAASSMAQDDMGHALVLFEAIAARTQGTPDDVALGRPAEAFRCCDLVTMPHDFDWALSLVRRALMSRSIILRLRRLATSCDTDLAARAARLLPEQELHAEHLENWLVRLGKGTDESKLRMQAAIDALQSDVCMIFEPTPGEAQLAASGLFPGSTHEDFAAFKTQLDQTLTRAGCTITLEPPADDARGGRRGVHADHFLDAYADLTGIWASEPGASW
jgi:ring-1,2-phenylacetyl-CoA epoxidase subunit PaaC